MRLLRTTALLTCAGLAVAGCQTTGNKGAYEAPIKAATEPAPVVEPEPVEKPPTTGQVADGRELTENQSRFKSYTFADLNPGERPAKDTDEAGLWMQVDRVEQQVATSGALITDPALNTYIRDLTCKIAGDYCGDIRVYIVRLPHFNATMSPNGMMNVYSGLLLRAQNEAQLATVLGHEIGHYLRRHSAQRLEDLVNKAAGLAAFQLFTIALGVPTVGSIAAIATGGSLAAFNRDNEREADGYGLLLMGRAGYSPHEAAQVWKNLQREYENSDRNKNRPIFYASHPADEERATVLEELAAVVPVEGGDPKLNTEQYRAAIQPHRFGFLEDELGKRDPDTFEALLDMLIEDGFDVGTLHYFKGEMFRVRGDDGDAEKALAEFEKAEEFGAVPAELFRAKGLILNRSGKKDEAKTAFAEYLRRAPDAKDKEMIKFMISGVGS